MKTIVVGFNASGEARDALALGEQLRKAVEGRLIVAVVDEFHIAYDYPAVSPELHEDFHKLVFAEAAEALGRDDFERCTALGSAPRGLIEIADGVDADAIVVGSTSRGALGRVLPGSVGERLLAGARCSVLVAPLGYAGEPQGRITTIGIAYDGGAESRHALEVAGDLATTLDATLQIITVSPPVQVPVAVPDEITVLPPDYAQTLRKHFDRQLEDAVGAVRGKVGVEPVLIEGDPVESLVEQSDELDLLVLGSRGYGPIRRVLLGGVSAAVVRGSACPVMIVPRSAEADAAEA